MHILPTHGIEVTFKTPLGVVAWNEACQVFCGSSNPRLLLQEFWLGPLYTKSKALQSEEPGIYTKRSTFHWMNLTP